MRLWIAVTNAWEPRPSFTEAVNAAVIQLQYGAHTCVKLGYLNDTTDSMHFNCSHLPNKHVAVRGNSCPSPPLLFITTILPCSGISNYLVRYNTQNVEKQNPRNQTFHINSYKYETRSNASIIKFRHKWQGIRMLNTILVSNLVGPKCP